jgi:hypothetical protein
MDSICRRLIDPETAKFSWDVRRVSKQSWRFRIIGAIPIHVALVPEGDVLYRLFASRRAFLQHRGREGCAKSPGASRGRYPATFLKSLYVGSLAMPPWLRSTMAATPSFDRWPIAENDIAEFAAQKHPDHSPTWRLADKPETRAH